MRTLFTIVLGCVLTTSAYSQLTNAPAIEWQRSYGAAGPDQLRKILETPGGYLMAGFSDGSTNSSKTNAGFGGLDYWVVRTDTNGTRLWDKSFGGTSVEFLRDADQTTDGGFILGGNSNSGESGNKSSMLQGNGTFNLGDFWVVRLDAAGEKLWDRSFGGTNDDVLFAVRETSDGGYILGGFSLSQASGNKASTNYGLHDFWVVRLNSTGDKLWDHTFGGTNSDILYDLQETADGGYVLGGVSASGISGNKTNASFGGEDMWLLKLDSNGNKLWETSFGGTANDGMYALQQLKDGGYLLGGYSLSTNSGNKASTNHGVADFWIVRVDGSGNKVWDRAYGGSNDDQLFTLKQMDDGGFVVGGYSLSRNDGNKLTDNFGPMGLGDTGDFWLIRLKSNGDRRWEAAYGGTATDRMEAIEIASDGGLLLGGDTESPISGNKTTAHSGQQDFWVVKLGPDALHFPPRLRPVSQTAEQVNALGHRFFLQGVSNVSYVLERSSQFSSWTAFQTNLVGGAESEIFDLGATNGHNFYRARVAE
jgi:hypothetical protein